MSAFIPINCNIELLKLLLTRTHSHCCKNSTGPCKTRTGAGLTARRLDYERFWRLGNYLHASTVSRPNNIGIRLDGFRGDLTNLLVAPTASHMDSSLPNLYQSTDQPQLVLCPTVAMYPNGSPRSRHHPTLPSRFSFGPQCRNSGRSSVISLRMRRKMYFLFPGALRSLARRNSCQYLLYRICGLGSS